MSETVAHLAQSVEIIYFSCQRFLSEKAHFVKRMSKEDAALLLSVLALAISVMKLLRF